MKARKIATFVVVALGAVSVAAPVAVASDAQAAKKKSKFQKVTEKDLKSLKRSIKALKTEDANDGKRVVDLQKASKETNDKLDATDARVTTIANAAVENLTALKDGLTTLGNAFKDFEYGAVQIAYLDGGTTVVPIGAAFLTTGRIDPTSQQSTVTGQFTVPTAADGDRLVALAVARSVNPEANDAKSTISCRFTASQTQPGGAVAEAYTTSAPSSTAKPSTALPFYAVNRTPLPPTSADEKTAMPFSLVASESSKATNLAATGTIGSLVVAGTPSTNAIPLSAAGGTLKVSLSCLGVPKS